MTESLPTEVVADFVAGASKLALGWLKARKAQEGNWTAGSFDLDLEAVLYGDVPIIADDYERIARGVQLVLQSNYPNAKYRVDPFVEPVTRADGMKLYICFLSAP